MKRTIKLMILALGVVAMISCNSTTTDNSGEVLSDSVNVDSIFNDLEKELGEDVESIIDTLQSDTLSNIE